MEDTQIKFKDTTATRKIFSLRQRIRAVCGGTSASKTISILVWCIDYAQSTKNNLISVVSESYPHLEKGAILDFQNIMKAQGYWKEDNWHDTKHTYTFETGTKIEFYSVDTYGKAHGPRRDVLFMNECNNMPYIIADQLITRTRKIVWMDWNPSTEFWFYTEMLGKREDLDHITLTYLDNEALDEITVREIESHKNQKWWWTVYGLGQLGSAEGKIYKDWQIVSEVPHEARLLIRWLDFGYTNDPTAIGEIYQHNGAYVVNEVAFQKGLSNRMIADILLALENPQTLVVADSAEPKSIDELYSYGINIVPAQKGKDSVVNGIQLVQSLRVSLTSRSVNIIKEFRNYLWKTDKNGKVINEPEHAFSHSMDGLRYGFTALFKESQYTVQTHVPDLY